MSSDRAQGHVPSTAAPAKVLWGTTVTVTLSTTFAVFPPLLLGATATLVREDLHFGRFSLGVTVALFFLVSAIASPLGGWIVRRIGVSEATLLSSLAVLGSLMTIALASQSWGSLTVLFAVAGLGNALAQPAANQALAFGVPTGRQGLAFGVKQAAIPLASLLAGLAIPTFAPSAGWRVAFMVGSLLPIVILPLVMRLRMVPSQPRRLRAEGQDPPGPSLALLSLAFGSGTAAASCVAIFMIESAVHEGIPLRFAGVLFALNSALGIGARITYGWMADRGDRRQFIFIAILILIGSLGAVALANGRIHQLFYVGSVAAFLGGWSWNGLFNLAIIRMFPSSPAVATGIVLAGGFGGSAIGPLTFGFLADNFSFLIAWLSVAGLFLLSATLMMSAAASESHGLRTGRPDATSVGRGTCS